MWLPLLETPKYEEIFSNLSIISARSDFIKYRWNEVFMVVGGWLWMGVCPKPMLLFCWTFPSAALHDETGIHQTGFSCFRADPGSTALTARCSKGRRGIAIDLGTWAATGEQRKSEADEPWKRPFFSLLISLIRASPICGLIQAGKCKENWAN